MRRIHILAVALVAIFAVSVAVVASASAVEFLLALWLDAGSPVSAQLNVEAEGELELIDLNGGKFGVHSRSLCSWIFDGWVAPESLGYISELLTLGGELIPLTTLTGTPLLCVDDENCTEPQIWASGLGWETEAELMVEGSETFLVDLIFNVSWYAECLILGVTITEICSAPETVARLTNEFGGTVDAIFEVAFQLLAGVKLGGCSTGGEESGEMVGLEFTLESGVTLSVSQE